MKTWKLKTFIKDIAILVIIIGFIACDTGTGSNSPPPPFPGIQVENEDVFNYSGNLFTGSGKIKLRIPISGGEPIFQEIGSITNGKLSFTLSNESDIFNMGNFQPVYTATSNESGTGGSGINSYNYIRTVNSNTIQVSPTDSRRYFASFRFDDGSSVDPMDWPILERTITTDTSVGIIFLERKFDYYRFIYCNEQTKVSGEENYSNDMIFFNDGNRTETSQAKTTYNLNLSSGWNIIFYSLYYTSDRNNPSATMDTYHYVYSNDLSRNINWVIQL